MFADSNFGIEIAGKQKGTKSGFGDPAAGDVTSAQSLAAPQAWKGAAAGLALQPLKQQSTWQERICKTWRLPAGTRLVTLRGDLGVRRQEVRLELESGISPCPAEMGGKPSPSLPTFQLQPGHLRLQALLSAKVGTMPTTASTAATGETQTLHLVVPQ